jgi:outer membrane protein insertion porin family
MGRRTRAKFGPETGHAARLRPLAVALFLGSATASASYFTPAFAQSFAFSSVAIEGNEFVDNPTILGLAGIARGQEISAAELNDAYQRIANSGLFEEVELVPQGSTLLIRVREYPTINVINFEGNRRLKDEALSEIIQSESRRVYSPANAEADAAAIAEAYRVQGRLAATVEPKIIRRDGNRVDLVFEIAEGRVVEIERLSFVGNRAFSDRRLRQVLETKQAGLLRTFVRRDTFIAERLELDKQLLTDFYLARGYVDVQVTDASADVVRERDATFVTFTIREGQSFRIGGVSTVSEVEGVDAAEFEAVQKIRGGQTWSPGLIENNIARMESLAQKKGLNFIRIDPRVTRNDADGTLDIEFALVRGERVFVERIDIEGNATTLDQVIRRQFRSVEGDPLNPREIRQSAERIRALGFFTNAEVEAQPGSSPDTVVVDVQVEEQPTGSLSFGLSYGVAAGLGGQISLTETNFLGRGQALSLSLSSGTDNANWAFSFTEPAFLGRDLRFNVNGYYRETDQQQSNYDTRNIGLATGIGFPISEQGRLDLRLKVSSDRISDLSPDSSAILQAEEAEGELLSSGIGYTYEYDNRLTGLNPNGGILLRFSQDITGLGGDTKYVSTTFLAQTERRVLNEEVTLRAALEGGVLSSYGGYTSRVTERYFGNGKIRGFEPNGIGPRDLGAVNEDALGGNAFAVARFEAEFPLGLPEEYGITGGLFLDVGSVWSLDNTAGTGGPVDDSLNLRSAAGLSIFWNTPIGPLRFNFSNALVKESYDKEQSFDLTLSTRF